MFINASGLLVLKLGCHHWLLNFFPPPFLLLFFTLSLPHPNTKYSLSLLLEDSYICLITLLLTDITLPYSSLYFWNIARFFFCFCFCFIFWPHWVFVAVRGLPLAVVSLLPHWVFVAERGLSPAVVSLLFGCSMRTSPVVASRVAEHGL